MIHLSFTILTAPCILWSLFLLLFFCKGFNFEMTIQIPFCCQVASLDVNPRDLAPACRHGSLGPNPGFLCLGLSHLFGSVQCVSRGHS